MSKETKVTANPQQRISDPPVAVVDEEKPAIQVYRRKALKVEAVQVSEIQELETGFGRVMVDKGDWFVKEGNATVPVKKDDFAALFDTSDSELPDLAPGEMIEHQGKKLVRVEVVAGRGTVAYWYRNAPDGPRADWKVIADMTDSLVASHRAGKFFEAADGKPGSRAWVICK